MTRWQGTMIDDRVGAVRRADGARGAGRIAAPWQSRRSWSSRPAEFRSAPATPASRTGRRACRAAGLRLPPWRRRSRPPATRASGEASPTRGRRSRAAGTSARAVRSAVSAAPAGAAARPVLRPALDGLEGRPTEMNSSAHSPSSDESAIISPSGVSMIARESCIDALTSAPCAFDQVPDDRALLLDQLPDAEVGEIEQRHQRVAPERDRFRRSLHLDEPAVAGLDDVHVDVGARSRRRRPGRAAARRRRCRRWSRRRSRKAGSSG